MTEQDGAPVPRFEIELPKEVEAGVPADFVSIWHTNDSFIMDFGAFKRPPELTDDGNGGKVVQVPCRINVRVRIPPAQVFEMMKALESQLSKWETETGQRDPGSGLQPGEG